MPKNPTLSQRLQYWRDNLMSKGPAAMIGFLAVLSMTIILFVSAIVVAAGIAPASPNEDRPANFIEVVWMGLMRTLDAGTMGGDTGSWWFLGAMFIITLAGVFVVSSLIGILSSGLDEKLEHLKKGRSLVLESGHTLILGWSPQIFTILSELMEANANQKDVCIVILADKDKVEMENEIRERVTRKGRTRVICRSGNPIDLTDLEIVSPQTSKSIIVLPPEDDAADIAVIKTVLAVTNNPDRRAEPYHIVTQIDDEKNMEILRLVGARDLVQAVLTEDLIARIVAQTSRQSGLSVVYTEMLNFGGDEIYFADEPSLIGKTYGEALLAYEDSAIMGLRKSDGTIALNPSAQTLIQPGDAVFGLSADDDTLRVSGLPSVSVDETLIRQHVAPGRPAPEKCLLLGWNRCASTIIRELDNYVAEGSHVLVIADPSVGNLAASARQAVQECQAHLSRQKVAFKPGDTTDRRLLDKIKVMDYDHVIVLSYDGMDVQTADAKTLVTLLHLRDIAEKDQTPFSIVSEMLDLRNRQLAEVTHVDDFIVSGHLVSLMMAQFSENADLFPVFAEIFDPQGAEVYLKPVGDYVELGKPVNFYTVVAAAARRGETAIGYRLAVEANDASRSYGVCTNPRKSEMVTFGAADKVIVLATS